MISNLLCIYLQLNCQKAVLPAIPDVYCIMDNKSKLLNPDFNNDVGFREDCSNYVFAQSEEELIEWKGKWRGTNQN